MAETSTGPRPWWRLTERKALRALLYVVMAVSAVIAFVQGVALVVPREYPTEKGNEQFNALMDQIRHHFNHSTMTVLFVVAAAALAVSSRADREP
jgi:ABC-type uncharacterized transport system permease subunit